MEGTAHEAVVHVYGHVRLVLVHALSRQVPCGQGTPVLTPPGNVVPPVRRRDRLTCGGADGALGWCVGGDKSYGCWAAPSIYEADVQTTVIFKKLIYGWIITG